MSDGSLITAKNQHLIWPLHLKLSGFFIKFQCRERENPYNTIIGPSLTLPRPNALEWYTHVAVDSKRFIYVIHDFGSGLSQILSSLWFCARALEMKLQLVLESTFEGIMCNSLVYPLILFDELNLLPPRIIFRHHGRHGKLHINKLYSPQRHWCLHWKTQCNHTHTLLQLCFRNQYQMSHHSA